MIASQELLRPWKGVYVVNPKENFGETIHLREYLDIIMSKCDRGYYVTLYDAIAELVPNYVPKDQSQYYVMMNGYSFTKSLGQTMPKMKLCYSINFPTPYIYTSKTKFGKLNVATPELLALDIVAYKNAVGGLHESVRLLDVIKSKLNFRRLQEDIFEYRTEATMQRLGYIIENVLGKPAKAQPLHDLLVKHRQVLPPNPLSLGQSIDGCPFDERWGVHVNEELKLEK